MPQVIISLPNAIFPFLAHLLNLQGHEEDAPPPRERTTPTPRRSHSRQSQHRRQPQTQTTPRHRSSRHNSSSSGLRHRRGQRTVQDIPQLEVPYNNNTQNETQHTLNHSFLISVDSQSTQEDDIITEEGSSSSPIIPTLSLSEHTIASDDQTHGESRVDDEDIDETDGEESSESPPPLDSEESTYGDDSDSEQFRPSPSPQGPHESEHDGDEETERRRRRRRRSTGRERTISIGADEGAENVVGGEAPASPTNQAANVGQADEREYTVEGRGFIGNGWWFLALLLMVQLYQSGGFLFLCMLALYVGFNSSAMLTYRSRSWKYKLGFLLAATLTLMGTIVFIYWNFREEKLWLYLIFIPSSFQFSVTSALWTVWVNEFIVVFFTIVMKHYLIIISASFRVFGQSTKKKMLALMEQGSKLYRCTLPIPVWLFYLYHAFDEETINIRFLGLELAKIIEHKTPEEMCKRATQEDIKKYTEDCAICREDLALRAPLTLPCSHVFCTECIYQWFDKHPSCPTCRTLVGTESMFEESSGNTNIHLQENGIGLSVSFDDL